MVAAANPYAVDAGAEVLRAGGSAVDAAVAVQAVLGLVEPQSSGLGGGAFMVLHDPKTQETWTYDGRETAPLGATSALFLDDLGIRKPSEAVYQTLFDLLEWRKGKPLIITTNKARAFFSQE